MVSDNDTRPGTLAHVRGRVITRGLMPVRPVDLVVAEHATISDPEAAFGVDGVEYFAHLSGVGARARPAPTSRRRPIYRSHDPELADQTFNKIETAASLDRADHAPEMCPRRQTRIQRTPVLRRNTADNDHLTRPRRARENRQRATPTNTSSTVHRT